MAAVKEEEPGACYLFHSLETTEVTETEWAALKKRKMEDESLECGTRKRTGHRYIQSEILGSPPTSLTNVMTIIYRLDQ